MVGSRGTEGRSAGWIQPTEGLEDLPGWAGVVAAGKPRAPGAAEEGWDSRVVLSPWLGAAQ